MTNHANQYDKSLAELKPYFYVEVFRLTPFLDRDSSAVRSLSVVTVVDVDVVDIVAKVRSMASYMLMIAGTSVAVSVARPAFVDMRNWMYAVARSVQMLMFVVVIMCF